MQIKQIKFKILREGATLPRRATAGAAAADLRARIDAPIVIPPRERTQVATGLAVELPDDGYAALVFPRSGNAKNHGITLANAVGLIDSDYRGEITVTLMNCSDEPFTVNDGDRIAQLMVTPVVGYEAVEAEQLSDTERGAGGFGSTGNR